MAITDHQTITVLAPAKINLYLHLTGRRADGYHLLDSLVVFADCGDKIRLKDSSGFAFSIDGPFARAFKAPEADAGPDSKNLVVRAARMLAAHLGQALDVDIRLTKNLPLAAGLGGGSSDAATVIWALLEWWGISRQAVPDIDDLLLSLGADVPACMACQPVRMRGIGEQIEAVDALPELPAVLVNPGKYCPTAEVFARFDGAFSQEAPHDRDDDLMAFLKAQRNDLQAAAQQVVPEITTALQELEDQAGCLLPRMSGSGATCFGVFGDELAALDAAEAILRDHPSWWVRACTLNRTQRY